jgi:ABC-type transport system involved in Fe-S cluster assembly fused permease/ATPase subunit
VSNIDPEWIHIGISVIVLVVTCVSSYFLITLRNTQLKIELRQEQNKAELLAHQQGVKDDLGEKHDELISNQTELHRDFDQKHAENKQQLAVHMADDTQQFVGIGRTLNRMENKLDRINGHS